MRSPSPSPAPRARRRARRPRRSTRSIVTPGAQLDALLEEGALDHGRHLGVLARQERGAASMIDDVGAEAAVGLGELDADRARRR